MRYYATEPGYVIAAAILLPLLDITAVALRFWARAKQKKAMKADDWLMVPATILVTAIGVAIAFGVAKGAIAHPTAIPPDFDGNHLEIETPQMTLIYKIQWAFDVAASSVRTAWPATSSRAASSAGFFLASLFQCGVGFSALWGSTLEIVQNCEDIMHLALAICITGFILDLITIGVPVPLVWRLNLSCTKKMAAAAVFLLGSVSIVASLLRLINLAPIVSNGFQPHVDQLLVVTQYFYWGVVESGVGIIAVCLPTLQFLIRDVSWEPTLQAARHFFRFRGRSKRSRSEPEVESNFPPSDERVQVAPLGQFAANQESLTRRQGLRTEVLLIQ
ncbi:hypothetical protein EKO27_g2081 [Xylaria grammica]|uniref:Rhodopsin domain-containing protein n=1 Tax=Xylaria grammica TaxID=363999 RepID=A0A439DF33_9PEZI|nr:hypothetical protein EKO27_g2081 [Xylaria grammica]